MHGFWNTKLLYPRSITYFKSGIVTPVSATSVASMIFRYHPRTEASANESLKFSVSRYTSSDINWIILYRTLPPIAPFSLTVFLDDSKDPPLTVFLDGSKDPPLTIFLDGSKDPPLIGYLFIFCAKSLHAVFRNGLSGFLNRYLSFSNSSIPSHIKERESAIYL
jgi:hypothetical protein